MNVRKWWNLAVLAVTIPAVAAVLGALAGPVTTTRPAAPPADDPQASPRSEGGEAPFPQIVPAGNPARLCLIRDDRKVLGWISGQASQAGREVIIACDGVRQTLLVQDDNTFTWHYRVGKAVDARVEVAGLSQSIRLGPGGQTLQPAVFFVLDRSVYRPNQPMHFAAFFRRLDEQGRFVPLADQPVEVRLTSQKTSTLAAKLALRTDAAGRAVGSYSFHEGDLLDAYDVTAVGYAGKATVTLAEFRKSKIRLKVGGQVEGTKLTLAFDLLDFMDKPVPGSRLDVTAQVVRSSGPSAAPGELNGDDFVYADPPSLLPPPPAELSSDEALLSEAYPSLAARTGLVGPSVLTQMKHTLDMAGRGHAEHVIGLAKDWLGQNCDVLVEAVATDQNGREQRSAERIRLPRAAQPLLLEAPPRRIATGKAFRLRANLPAGARATAVVLAVEPGAGGMYPPYASAMNQQFDPGYAYYSRISRRPAGWYPYGQGSIHHRYVCTVPFDGDHADLSLDSAGPYRVIVAARMGDGTVREEQAGLIVQDGSEMPRLRLRTDQPHWRPGQSLTGRLESAFKDAVVLLTLRDSQGVRAWRVVRLAGTSGRFEIPLPAGLSYGCSLVAQYHDGDRPHLAQQPVHVLPDDRMITIRSQMKESCQPGDTVRIDFQVDRTEPVDLVVSVYDQSLLGIAPDRNVDIRSFFLADQRAQRQAAMDLLRRRLGDLTVAEAEKLARSFGPEYRNDPTGQIRNAVGSQVGSHLYLHHLTGLLQAAGVPVQIIPNRWGYGWHFRLTDPATRLADLLDAVSPSEHRLALALRDETVLLAETHPNQPLHAAFAPYPGFDRRGARGDSHFSASANAMHSVSGQAFISHMPDQPQVELIQPDPAQGDIAVRRDFSDSAFWNATVRTDAAGRAGVEFKLPDSITNWQVVATAVSRDMHLGHHKARFRSSRPIMVWPMIPRVFTEGDRVRLFATVHNTTDRPQTIRVHLKVQNGSVLDEEEKSVLVQGGSNLPVYWTFQPGQAGFTQLLMTAACPAGSDASLKRLPVVCPAADEIIALAGYCKNDAILDVPAEIDLASAKLDMVLVPSLAADMVDTLSYLVEYPHGCVEQTMSRFLPAIKVAQILKRFHIEHKELSARLPGCVDAGIKRLLQLQQPDGGWAWHGSGQTHEMMTPYALYGLLEAEAAGYAIPSEQALQRGLARLRQFIDSMGQAQAADRIYCMYVWSHRNNLEPGWWKFIQDELTAGRLSDYALALSLEMACRKGQDALSHKLAQGLRKRVVETSQGLHWRTARFSRWGDDVHEITAAALKALAVYDAKDPMISGVLDYFARTKQDNRWNSTKSTAMVLYATCEYLARTGDADKPGLVSFRINDGRLFGVNLEGGLCHSMRMEGESLTLRPGQNRISFEKFQAGTMYRLTLRHRRRGGDLAASSTGLTVTRRIHLLEASGKVVREVANGQSVPRGSYLMSTLTVQKANSAQMRYLLVTNPKLSCAEIVPADDKRFPQQATSCVLREDKTVGVFYHHEAAAGSVVNSCVFLAEMAGQYVLPPAQAELMYDTAVHGHSGTMRITVTETDAPATVARKD